MAKKDGSTVSASSIISAFVFALLVEVTNYVFNISSTIGLRFSGVLFFYFIFNLCHIAFYAGASQI